MAHTKQQKKADEFLDSNCDLFSSDDFLYYAEATGKGIDWIMANAKYNDKLGVNGTCLDNAIIGNDYELANLLI